jgi:hypothetical protein
VLADTDAVEHPMNRRQLLAHATAGLGLLALAGCASGNRRRAMATEIDHGLIDPVRHRAPTRESRLPDDFEQIIGRPTGPAGVIPRSQWTGAAPIDSRADPMRGFQRITVHHDGMSPFYSANQADAMRRLESIRRAHVGQGWADIGYHFAIDPAGKVYACRPLTLQGAHVKDQNPGNIGVMVMGNFEQQMPTPQAINALEAFLAALMRQHRLGARAVFTHRELAATACPGRNLQTRMVQARASGGKLAFA